MTTEDSGPRAIVTVYKGYRFRSRLEARWAVFFDALGLPWEYEVEGFNLGSGVLYLPDFWMPSLDAFIEIKGTPFERGDDAWEKASRLAAHSEKSVYVFCGQIKDAGNVVGLRFTGVEDWPGDPSDPWHTYWFRCTVCGQFNLGRTAAELPCCDLKHRHPDEDEQLVEALSIARQADFRRGEAL